MLGPGEDARLAEGEAVRSGGPGEYARLVGTEEEEANRPKGWRLPSRDTPSVSLCVKNGCHAPIGGLHRSQPRPFFDQKK